MFESPRKEEPGREERTIYLFNVILKKTKTPLHVITLTVLFLCFFPTEVVLTGVGGSGL